jgi:hypothetical protein
MKERNKEVESLDFHVSLLAPAREGLRVLFDSTFLAVTKYSHRLTLFASMSAEIHRTHLGQSACVETRTRNPTACRTTIYRGRIFDDLAVLSEDVPCGNYRGHYIIAAPATLGTGDRTNPRNFQPEGKLRKSQIYRDRAWQSRGTSCRCSECVLIFISTAKLILEPGG